jgi:hypothetical protein
MTRKLVHLVGAVTALMFSFTASAGTTLWHKFTTTVGGGTTYSVSPEGNVYSIESPTGYEHVHIGFDGRMFEGYVLCWSVNGLESGADDIIFLALGFSPATHSSAAPFTVTRTTLDGRLQLKQVFTFNATSKSLNIVMTIKNLTGATINNIVLNRIVNSLVDGRGANGFAELGDNWHAATHDAVPVWNDPANYGFAYEAHGLVLRHLTQSGGGGITA